MPVVCRSVCIRDPGLALRDVLSRARRVPSEPEPAVPVRVLSIGLRQTIEPLAFHL